MTIFAAPGIWSRLYKSQRMSVINHTSNTGQRDEVMHPDQRALLDTIIAHQDDDLPRLVYADWLEERFTNFKGYADFIRWQCEAPQ